MAVGEIGQNQQLNFGKLSEWMEGSRDEEWRRELCSVQQELFQIHCYMKTEF